MTVQPPRWLTTVLWLAATYNLFWGSWVAFFPAHSFTLLDITPPNYLSLWQAVGLIVALFGVCYAMAAIDPLRFWPNLVVGLTGKVIGPAGFLFTALRGELPWRYGIHVIFCDLIWWIPFVLAIRWAYHAEWRRREELEAAAAPRLEQAMQEARDQLGRSLAELSQAGPQLVIFLRHLGCIFCGDLLGQISGGLATFRQAGLGLVFVHMGTDAQAGRRLGAYGLDDYPRISDPERRIYRAFGLGRGRVDQLLALSVIRRALGAFLRGAGVNRFGAHMDQLPGIFIVRDGRIVKSFAARSPALFVPVAKLGMQPGAADPARATAPGEQ